MRITLIKPNIGRRGHALYVDEARMEPLQLGVLAALTPPDVDVVLHDDRVEQIPYDQPTDLVAITVETFTARRSYEISAEYARRGVPVVMGGMHATLVPAEVAAHCDSVVVGDAEDRWAELIDDFRSGCLQERYLCQTVAVPQPGLPTRRDLFVGKGYLPLTLLQFSRGCRFACRYCASSVYFDRSHHCRDVGEVVAEIRAQRRRNLFFVDDNIVADPERAKELFRALIPLRVRWVSQASIDMLGDSELMRLMVRSGCLGHVIGFESISADSVAGMGKAVNRADVADTYRGAVAALRQYGLQTWAAFTLGHDTDTVDSIIETCEFALRSRFCFAAYNILMPYPGTPCYDDLRAAGRLLYDGRWWLHPDYRFNHAAFQPSQLSAQELTEWSWWCRRKTNSIPSIIYRAMDTKTNLRSPYRFLMYCAYNPLFRRETFKKQDMSFGYGDSDDGERRAS